MAFSPSASSSANGVSDQQSLVIAIDFGTTFTGVAYAYGVRADSGGDTGLSPEQLRDKIEVVKDWPGVAGSYSDKVPTELAYDATGRLLTWGGRVTPSHRITVAHFKLGLQEDLEAHYAVPPNSNSGWANFILGRAFSPERWRHPSLTKTPYNYVEDFLRELRMYVMEVYLHQCFGENFLTNLHVQYVLTVPAIWSDKAKDSTKRAAVSAGIPANRLSLVTEPEAAALYCSTLCREVDLEGGEYFLVCDAGGGTVVRQLLSMALIART
jgi:molecular chaperone DnaK (HSP70)